MEYTVKVEIFDGNLISIFLMLQFSSKLNASNIFITISCPRINEKVFKNKILENLLSPYFCQILE